MNKAEIKQAWSLVKSRRITAEHTQQHLAEYLGIKQIDVSNYENCRCASKQNSIEKAMAYYYITNADVEAHLIEEAKIKAMTPCEFIEYLKADQPKATMIM